MTPFPLPRIEPRKRRLHALARIRALLVPALCVLIGMALGGLWHSRRQPRTDMHATGTTQDASTPSAATSAPLQSLEVPVQNKPSVDPAIVAEVKRQIPNFTSVSLEEGSRILREAALKDLRAALSQMEAQVKEAEQRVARAEETKSETEKQAALKELQRLQTEQAAKLRECTTRSSAQIEALRQLQELAR